MSDIVEESTKIEKSLFGTSPTESLLGSSADSPAPSVRSDPSPAPSRGESTASAQTRFTAEDRRSRRSRLVAGNLSSPQLGFQGLLGL